MYKHKCIFGSGGPSVTLTLNISVTQEIKNNNKVLKFKRPLYLFNLLESNITNYESATQQNYVQTKSKPFFNIPYHTKKIYDFSFAMQAMTEWNELDVEIRNINKLNTFKGTKKNLLQRACRVH